MPARGVLRFATDRPQRVTVAKYCDCCLDPIIEWDYQSISSRAHEFGRSGAVRTKDSEARGHRFEHDHAEGVIGGGEDEGVGRGVVTRNVRRPRNEMHVR